MHHEWRKGIEQFKNRFSFNFQFDKDVSEDEKEATILMTMAAPDLLEALQAMVDEVGKFCYHPSLEHLGPWFTDANAAIAKATGK